MEGLAVSERGLYWHNSSEQPGSAPWDEFKAARIEKKGLFVIQIGNRGNFSGSASSDTGRKWVLDFLQQLQAMIRNS